MSFARHRDVVFDPAPRGSDARARSFLLHPRGAAGRGEVESLIRDVYRDRYAAPSPALAPVLVALWEAGRPVAAAGYRPAARQPLYLERYLGRAVEELLPRVDGVRVDRSRIVEVGNLAARRAGEGRALIEPLARHLVDEGYLWVVSTVTRELRAMFARLGIAPLELGAADAAALGDERREWGRYYDHDPRVMAAHLPQSSRRLATIERRRARWSGMARVAGEARP
jgi:hypothetical protein